MPASNFSLITSRQNPLCKIARSMHSRKGRREHSLFLAEGDNSVAAALEAKWPLKALLGTPEALEERREWVGQVSQPGIAIHAVSAELLAYLADAETSPGIIALVQLPETPSLRKFSQPDELLLLLDGIADSGNVGTLIRSADAIGAGVVGLTQNAADPFSPKTVRASAGSIFHLPLAPQATPAEWVEHCRRHHIPLVVAVAHGGDDCFHFAWPRRCALVLGHETRGISPEIEAAATARVTIPMYGRAESLNVAVAGAVLLYAWRQAHIPEPPENK